MSSKYSKKKKKASAPRKVAVAQNNYTSKCCNAPAKKPALVSTSDWKDPKATAAAGLGKFRCGECGKRCVVSRSKTSSTTSEVA